MNFFFALICTLFGCAHGNHPAEPAASEPVEELRAAYDGWQKDLKAKADPNTGWFSDDCDGTLWVGEAVASGFPAQVGLAEQEGGLIGRRRAASGDCHELKESATQSSPDMRLGYMIGQYAMRDKQALERVESYAREHKWLTGAPTDRPENLWKPNESGILYRALKSLGSEADDKGLAKIGVICGPVEKDFQYHVQTLAILFDGDVSGGISDACLLTLKLNAELYPDDALIQAAAGVYTGDTRKAYELILNNTYRCPSYVRSGAKYPDAAAAYCTIHKAYAARVLLKRHEP